MWSRVKTASTVIVVSSLIWVFAERRVTTEDRVEVKVILPSPHGEGDPFLQFMGGPGSLLERYQTVKVVIKGPTSRIQKIRSQEYPFEVRLNLERTGYNREDSGVQDLRVQVIDQLKDQLRFENVPLSVIEVSPSILDVRVTQLIRRGLPVRVYDRHNTELSQAKVYPNATVNVFVLADKAVEARVVLSAEQYERAFVEPTDAVCQVILPDRTHEKHVLVELSQVEIATSVFYVKNPKLYVAMPWSMLGKHYKVEEFGDPRGTRERIECHGSQAAFDAYNELPYHLLLVLKSDDKANVDYERELQYNVPEGHGELEITEPKRLVQYRLIEVEEMER